MLDIILKAIIETATKTDQVTDQVIDQVTDQVKKLIYLLEDGPQSAAELMALLGLSHRPTFRKNYLHPAMNAGLIEMTNPDSPNAKNQKYMLTEKGKGVGEEKRRV